MGKVLLHIPSHTLVSLTLSYTKIIYEFPSHAAWKKKSLHTMYVILKSCEFQLKPESYFDTYKFLCICIINNLLQIHELPLNFYFDVKLRYSLS